MFWIRWRIYGSEPWGGIRVSFIARWSGKIAAGAATDHISAFWDILPTCAEPAGVDAPAKLDGISLGPTLIGPAGTQQERPYLYWEFSPRKTQAVGMDGRKAVRFIKTGAIELYNVEHDRGETTDLSAHRPAVPARIKLIMGLSRTPSRHFPLMARTMTGNPARTSAG
jgi:arylsulfatase A-like enzyme